MPLAYSNFMFSAVISTLTCLISWLVESLLSGPIEAMSMPNSEMVQSGAPSLSSAVMAPSMRGDGAGEPLITRFEK